GASKIEKIIEKAAEYKQTAVAMTDHGNMHGAIEFYETAREEGIKPIIGCEIYITSGSRLDRTPRAQGGAPTDHLTLLASDLTGYRNLCKLVTLGFTEGFYFKPRVDHEVLKSLSSGLICLSGCVSGEFASHAKIQDIEGARDLARRFQSIFGER